MSLKETTPTTTGMLWLARALCLINNVILSRKGSRGTPDDSK